MAGDGPSCGRRTEVGARGSRASCPVLSTGPARRRLAARLAAMLARSLAYPRNLSDLYQARAPFSAWYWRKVAAYGAAAGICSQGILFYVEFVICQLP